MNFSTAGLNILSANTTQLSATYLQNTLKLSQFIPMLKPLFGQTPKRLLISSHKQTLTQISKLVIDLLPVTSANSIVLRDILRKCEDLGDGSSCVVLFAAILAKNLIKRVDDGFSRSAIACVLRKIRRDISLVPITTLHCDLSAAGLIVSGIVQSDELCVLVDEACKLIFGTNSHSAPLETSQTIGEALSGKKNTKPQIHTYENNITIEKNVIQKENDIKTGQADISTLIGQLEDRIRIVKVGLGTLKDSKVKQGLVYQGKPRTNITEIENARTSIFNCPIEISHTTEKGILSFENADQLLQFSKNEEKNIQNLTKDLTCNSNLVVCCGKVEDAFLQHFNDYDKTLVFSLQSKHDIRRIRNLFEGIISPVLRVIPAENCGKCEKVSIINFGPAQYTWFYNKNAQVATIILRNSLSLVLDEYERNIQKGLKALTFHYPNYVLIKGCGHLEKTIVESITDVIQSNDLYESGIIETFKTSLLELISDIKVQDNIYDLVNVRVKALQYAIDVCCIVLETEDMFAVRDALNIGTRPDIQRDMQ